MRLGKKLSVIVLIAMLAVVAAACGDDDATTTTGAVTTTAAEGGGKIVAFIPVTTNTYIAEWARGAQLRADELGYDLLIIENNFDQAEEDTQVQQQLGVAGDVKAWIWWPSDNEAGVASLQALGESGIPVIQTNQYPYPGSEQYLIGYAGVDDTFNGEVAGQLVVEARDWMVANGIELHSAGGNAIIVGFVAGYQAGIDRTAAATQVMEAAGITVLGMKESGFDPATGYAGAKELIAAYRDAGIDLVYAHNSALNEGVIQALEEEGYVLGPENPTAMAIAGTCHGNLEYLENGKEFATGLQAARLEGIFSINTLHEYLTTGALASFNNFIPNPPIHSPVYGITADNELETVKLEGFSVEELCSY